jgi:hypothetical protein
MTPLLTLIAILQVLAAFLVFIVSYLALFFIVILVCLAADLIWQRSILVREKSPQSVPMARRHATLPNG